MAEHEFFGQIPQADVTDLDDALAAKSDTGHTHDYAATGHNHDASYQATDSDLTAIAGLSPSNDDVIQRKSGAWTNRTMAQVKTDLALTKSDVGLSNVDNTSDANKPVSSATQTALDGKQPLDSDLTTIAGLTATTDNVIQSVGSAWASRTPAQLKSTLALVKGDVGLGNVDNTADASKSFAASQITSGSLDIARIPTGTTSSTVAIGNDTRLSVKPYPPVTLTDGATPALNAALGTHFRLTAAGNRTIAVPSNPTDGQVIVIEHTASGADRTLALNTGTGGFAFGTDITALTATVSAKTDLIQAVYNSAANKWWVIGYIKGF